MYAFAAIVLLILCLDGGYDGFCMAVLYSKPVFVMLLSPLFLGIIKKTKALCRDV